MNPLALISVIVPCYNQEDYIDECLESVYNQTYTHWECIIINDGSTDESEKIIKKWVALDSRFIYHKQNNVGLSSTRNKGLEIAKGKYIQFLDGDDTLSLQKFEKQIQLFTDTIDIIICDYFPVDNDTGSFRKDRYLTPFPDVLNYKKDVVTRWEKNLSIPCHCVLFKSSLIYTKPHIFFDITLPNHEDWLFWVQLFYKSKQITFSHEAYAHYRIRKDSMCTDVNAMNQGFVIAAEKVLDFFMAENDKEFMNYAHQKLKEVKNKYDRYTSNPAQILNTDSHNPLSWRSSSFFSSARKMISLLTPPVLWHTWQWLKNARNNSPHK
jgi:glycosyltransferase involved in cell wall biosynthesis